jgi:hypothetical protein
MYSDHVGDVIERIFPVVYGLVHKLIYTLVVILNLGKLVAGPFEFLQQLFFCHCIVFAHCCLFIASRALDNIKV